MTSIEFYERDTVIRFFQNTLNQINQECFGEKLSVTDNGDYVTVKTQGLFVANYDIQKLWDALENYDQDDCVKFDDLWDYLNDCKYTLSENQKLLVKLENLLDEIDCTYFSHCRSKLSIEQQNDEIVNIRKNGKCLSFFIQPLVSSLDNVSDSIVDWTDDLWDHLEYEFQFHGVKTENELKTDNELSFSEKRQVALVDMLLSEPVPTTKFSGLDEWTISLIPDSQNINTESSTLSELVEELEQENKQLKESIESLSFSKENDYQECLKYITSEKTHLNKCIKQLQEEYQELERKNEQSSEQLTVLNETMSQLSIRVYKLEEENKQLKNNQLEVETKSEPKPEPEPKPTAKKRPKFKLPENFADYQQECDDLINALSCFYNIKKGKWNGNILQFILTPNDTAKAHQLYPYPDKWKAGLYLQPGQWTMGKVNMSDPDEWEEHFMDINDFADSNDIEIS